MFWRPFRKLLEKEGKVQKRGLDAQEITHTVAIVFAVIGINEKNNS